MQPSKKLHLDLIPHSAWGSNLRKRYPEQWDDIRKATYRRTTKTFRGCRCETCGVLGKVEAHERWSYEAPRQVLVDLVSLCYDCHLANHYGFARTQGLTAQVDAHIMRVNNWTPAQLQEHLEAAFATWHARNKIMWFTDTSLIDNALAATGYGERFDLPLHRAP